MNVLDNHQVGDLELEDEWIWILDEDRGFSIKFVYEVISILKPDSSPGACASNPLI